MSGIKRALLSVWDKTGIVDLARELQDQGVEIVSSGGTAQALARAGLAVREVSDLTGSPEMLEGRVKTLHPLIHAGILARRADIHHLQEVEKYGIPLIDLVVCNLYPFEEAIRRPEVSLDEVQQNIDIGGPTLVRAAAKNFQDVVVLVSPGQYPVFLKEIRKTGEISRAARQRFAEEAFARVAQYDLEIVQYFSSLSRGESLPSAVGGFWEKVQDLRYGENPHQRGALYREASPPPRCLVQAKQLQGKELSFNNFLDLQALLDLLREFDQPACAIVKHNNPCGVGLGKSSAEAYRRALECDPVSAFGGVVGFTTVVDGEAYREMASLFLEVILAPEYTSEALHAFRGKKNLRLMVLPAYPVGRPELPSASAEQQMDWKRISGGMLVQDHDLGRDDPGGWKLVTRRLPSPEETEALGLAWKVVRHVRSNAIAIASAERTHGVGIGQTSRVEAVELAVKKAQCCPSPGAVLALASDGFFPFRDSIDLAARAGILAVVQPGGSIRDPEVIQACDEKGVAMLFTGRRHFRH